MTESQDVLVRTETGAEALCGRLRRLGFSAEAVACTSRLRARLAPGRGRLAVLVGSDLPEPELAQVFEALAEPLSCGQATGVMVGPRPCAGRLARFRQAGFSLSLLKPFGDPALRFQVNRAFLHERASGPARCELRAPLDWRVAVRQGQRRKPVGLYNLSEGGAYLETPRPSLRGVALSLELPLPAGTRALSARVVHTNVPGNVQRERVPYGMGVCFEGLSPTLTRELAGLVTEHAESLVV